MHTQREMTDRADSVGFALPSGRAGVYLYSPADEGLGAIQRDMLSGLCCKPSVPINPGPMILSERTVNLLQELCVCVVVQK